jgi:hypothetical protein
MPFTQSDFTAIKALIKDGKIDQAKSRLKAANDPRADVMLAKLLDKYPDVPLKAAAVSATSDLDKVKSLIAQKRYEEAEALLWGINDPEADVLLRKLKAVQSLQQPVAKPAGAGPITAPISGFQVKAKKQSASGFGSSLRWAVIGMLVVIVGMAGVFFVVKKREADEKPKEIFLQLYGVCYYLAISDDREVSTYTSEDALTQACENMALDYMSKYPALAERCYDESGGDVLNWFGCNAKTSADLDMQWLIDVMR